MNRPGPFSFLSRLALLGGLASIGAQAASHPSLGQILEGSTLLLASRVGGEYVFQADSVTLYQGRDPITASALAGSDLYYLAEASQGYYKNGTFHPLDLKKYSRLKDIAVLDDTVHIAGWESDSINAHTAGASFLLRGDRKHVFPSAGPSAFDIHKLLPSREGYLAAGRWKETFLWSPDSLLPIAPASVLRLLALAKYRNSPLVAGLEPLEIDDMLWLGGWYWHQGVKRPIKYKEDGNEKNPFDHLRVQQFIVSGDSLLAIGDAGASYYLWINGKATLWEDTSVEKESLLGIARTKGVLYLLGQYQKDGKYVLCLWAKGSRVDLKEDESHFQVSHFKVVDAGLAVDVRGRPRPGKAPKSKAAVRRSASPLYGKPGVPEGARATADGRVHPTISH